MKSGIYKIEIAGWVYVGSTKDFNNRLNDHMRALRKGIHQNIILQRVYTKHGEERLSFSIIEHCEYVKDKIIQLEDKYISQYREIGKCCNISSASFGDALTNHPLKKDIIKKRQETAKLNMFRLTKDERVEKYGKFGIANGMHGKTHSAEARKIISETNKGNSYAKGARRSEEFKKKISEAASLRTGEKNHFYGKQHSDETKKKIASANLGKKPPNRIKILINGKEFDSYSDASRALQISNTVIRWRCLSKNKRFIEYQIIGDDNEQK